MLLIAFCSPYWLQSWEDTHSPFLNMGLWEFCFYRFRSLIPYPYIYIWDDTHSHFLNMGLWEFCQVTYPIHKLYIIYIYILILFPLNSTCVPYFTEINLLIRLITLKTPQCFCFSKQVQTAHSLVLFSLHPFFSAFQSPSIL